MPKVSIPLKIPSLNTLLSMHWAKRHKILKDQKKTVFFYLRNLMLNIQNVLPCTVILTRNSPSTLDYDNLLGAFKSIRDEIAAFLIPGLQPGRADDDERITWQYKQESAKSHSITIEIISKTQEDLPS